MSSFDGMCSEGVIAELTTATMSVASMNVAAIFAVLVTSRWHVDAVTMPCIPDGALDVFENKTDNTVTCSDIPADFIVEWRVRVPDSLLDNTPVGSCASVGSCTVFSASGYTVSRPSAERSVMTIDPVKAAKFVITGVSLTCQASKIGQTTQSTSCRLNIASAPISVLCIVQPVTNDSMFNVAGHCEVTRMYSSLRKYTCQWYTKPGISEETLVGEPVTIVKTADNGATPTGGTYINGSCKVTMLVPTNDATYSYRVVVTPGGCSQAAGTLNITAPRAGPTIYCRHSGGQYIPENTALDCTCTVSDLGQPQGRLVGYYNSTLSRGQLGNSSLTLPTFTVSRQNGHVIVRCVVDWATNDSQDKSATFNATVAYGPDTVMLNDSGVYDLNPSSAGTMTLTCTALASSPGVTYSWSRTCDGGTSGSTCRFTPNVSDHNTSITCTVTNTATQVTRNASGTITLNWPPPEAPSLSGFSGHPLYSGQSLTITCAVNGGNPEVSKVTISCGNRTWAPSGQTSTAQLQVDTSLNGVTCLCGGSWKLPTWYTKTADVTIVVYYSPEMPRITYPNYPLPLMVGETTTLFCQLMGNTSQGNPPATLTWSGQQSHQAQREVILTLGPLKAADNGQNYRCEASNAFTLNNNTRVVTEINISVYYKPDVRVTALQANRCQISSTPNTCVVSDGERVHFNCTADSNPAAASIMWTQSGDNILDFTASRTTDTTQICTASTKSVAGDPRLPLRSSLGLSVLVTYGSTLELLTINNHQDHLTVTEGDFVNITCSATGRPTPAVTLYRYRTRLEPFLLQGDVTADQVVTLPHVQPAATCKMTAPYTCEVKNDLAAQTSRTTHLFVNCQPRKSDPNLLETPTVDYVDTPQDASFNLVAYPVPDNFTFSYLGPSPDNRSQTSRPVTSNTLQMNCFTTNVLYNVTCNVTVDNITVESEAGLYGVRVSNAFGDIDLEFMITFNESKAASQLPTEQSIGAAVGGGIAAAVGVIIVAVVILLFIRRQRRGSDDSVRRRTKEKNSDKIKLATPDHCVASSTHDKAMSTDEKQHEQPTAVLSPKRKSKPRTHHGKAGEFYENVELSSPARRHNDEHPPSTSTEHSANQPINPSMNHSNRSSTTDHQSTRNAPEDDHANHSANMHTASPAAKKHSPNPSAHQTHDVRANNHSSSKQSQKPPPSPSTHTRVTTADADDYEETEPAVDTKASETALYNDVEYMTSQGATLGLDPTQQYLLDKLRGSQLNEEFGKLLTGHQADCNVGSKGANRSKNRFNSSILPYDANRVALLEESNDYINASRIRGYLSSKSYIAAQGPKKNTVIDFWKMVWQEKITHIAMLTNLTEGEKIKCAEYWPSHRKHIRYGSVIVTSIDVSCRANYVVRTFEIKGSGDSPCRHVSQYHFNTWLDHSIPSATALVDFWRTVSTSHGNQILQSPLLVHCSAGVGRTGTFIALDIALETFRDGKEINVFHIIQRMREDRINMVQTASQYRFLHEAILEAYTSRHTRLALLAFNSFFPNEIDPNKRIDKTDHEFKLLNQMKVLLNKPCRTVASSEKNFKKNRTVIFPDDNHVVYLSTFVKGRNQYINAVFMTTFYGRRGCILTQLPLQDTLIDIWRLVDENDVTTIVSIGAEVDGTEVKCCYWPRKDGESTKFGPFTVTLKSKTTFGNHLTSYELSFQLKNSSESRDVFVVQYRGWTGEIPDSTQDLLQLVDLVNSRSVRDHEDEEDKEASPVVVQCLDGATKSGLFRVICDVISRLTLDHDVDVYMAVRQVQIVQPESVTSEVQFRYIYHVIQEYQKRNAVYNN